ncbi:MAG TPA: hypothetical protein PK122_03550 [Candidatus Paceibacterota bacterium]|nr:hypothetical protein [Candidatus Paceibacterota bacterium]
MPRRKKERPFHYWNYRVITTLHPSGERLFSVTEVHYENGIPQGSADKNIMQGFSSLKELIWTNNRIKEALKKPILDGDNWPNEWIEEK